MFFKGVSKATKEQRTIHDKIKGNWLMSAMHHVKTFRIAISRVTSDASLTLTAESYVRDAWCCSAMTRTTWWTGPFVRRTGPVAGICVSR